MVLLGVDAAAEGLVRGCPGEPPAPGPGGGCVLYCTVLYCTVQVEAVEAGLENGGNMLEAVTSLTNLTTRWIVRVNKSNDDYYHPLSVSAAPGDPWRRVSAA